MAAARPAPDWLSLTPFWHHLSRSGPRAVVIDIPLAYAPQPFNGVEVSGWATHELLQSPAAYPPETMRWMAREFGEAPRADEWYGLESLEGHLRIRDELSRATESVGAVASALMRREAWDLFMVGLAATHRGGHKLWDATAVSGHVSPADAPALRDALRQVYMTCDTTVGRLVDAANRSLTVMVFSLHGMGSNTCRADLLPQMLERVLAGAVRHDTSQQAERPGFSSRVRTVIPAQWRHQIKRRLPLALQDKLTAFWRVGRVDWSATRAISLVADLQGYVRVNLRGREAAGIVDRETEYDALCIEIEEGLKTFHDEDTGADIVDTVVRSDALYPGGQRVHELPDLIVQWAPTPAADHRALVSSRFGSIAWPMPGQNPTGRSGNHRPEGFLMTAGPGIAPGASLEKADIVDLAPTVYGLFGMPAPPSMRGRSLLSG
jgi:predicted AlkP superfamily phosphohydrolase/phosphomutase